MIESTIMFIRVCIRIICVVDTYQATQKRPFDLHFIECLTEIHSVNITTDTENFLPISPSLSDLLMIGAFGIVSSIIIPFHLGRISLFPFTINLLHSVLQSIQYCNISPPYFCTI